MATLVSKKHTIGSESNLDDHRPAKKHKKKNSDRFQSENENVDSAIKDLKVIKQSNLASKKEPEQKTRQKNGSTEAKSKDHIDAGEESDNNSESDETDSSSASHIYTTKEKKKRKRNDPESFATSISKILGSKLVSSKRTDPVLARSAEAQQASKKISELALESAVKQKIRGDKKEALEKGRVRDVLGANMSFDAANNANSRLPEKSFQETLENERRMRKTAQRGVIKLFNAVRAAQIKGEEAAREARSKGIVGQQSKEEKINNMSKKGFLELIAKGGGEMRAGDMDMCPSKLEIEQKSGD
ncbi:putative ribosomal rna-processing protein 15 [Golovinomyces cichoracearum]|uniref:Putative ribosomal rna-processing protein 15 n=1 Tax=Golovinomyces cichoracearum TaxID=62708 RepID=A0A420JBE9_9PEZI|nr:putative ribosomal rna-processing protein 15 [Golovinomyces cichoracearum]